MSPFQCLCFLNVPFLCFPFCVFQGGPGDRPQGKTFGEDSIGEAMATRAPMDMLRQRGE